MLIVEIFNLGISFLLMHIEKYSDMNYIKRNAISDYNVPKERDFLGFIS